MLKLLSAVLLCTILSVGLTKAWDVVVPKDGDTVAIRIPGLTGPSGKEATDILTHDLQASGLFTIVSSGASYSVEGSASNSSVDCNVFAADASKVLSPSGSGDYRRAAHKVADQIIAKLTGKKGFASTRIAFISDKSGKKELYVIDYDGGNPQRFTSDKVLAVCPNFSKSGSRIAYTSYHAGNPDGYIVDYPGGGRQRVAAFPGLNSGLSFSPSGSKIALTLSKDGNPELYTMSDGGGDLKRLTRTRWGEASPSWSPDGSEIVYAADPTGRPQLYIVSAQGGAPRKITSSPAYNTEPNWSSESGKIAYSSGGGRDFAISVMDPSTGRAEEIYSNGNCEDPSWAPDGRHLVFTRTVGYHSDLYILDTVTKEAVQLTRNFGNCTEPTWSGR